MSDQVVQLNPDGTGKKVDVSEVTVGANVVERQRIGISDPIDPDAHARVRSDASFDDNDFGTVTRSIVHAVSQTIKRPLDVIVRALGMASDPVSGRLRTLTDLNGGTVTTCTTVTNVTSVNQIAAQSAQFVLVYPLDRTNWANNVRTRIV